MQNFRDVIGHKRIVEHLQKAIRNRQVSHAYIFDGADGAGKRMVANIFAAALQCTEGGIEPCGRCTSCLQMQNGNQPDVSYITHEKTIISVDDIREQLCAPMTIKPYAGPYRIFIVDEAEKMNEQAQNALLKTMEEPPEYGVILLLTNNKSAFLPTILSRGVELSFLPAGEEELMRFLMEKAQLPDYRARLAAAFSGGNPGTALRCARSEEFQSRKDNVAAMMKALPDMHEERMAGLASDFATDKEGQDATLDLMLVWLRDVMVRKAGGAEAKLMFAEDADAIAAQAGMISYEGLLAMQEHLAELRSKKRANVNMETGFWLLLTQLAAETEQ